MKNLHILPAAILATALALTPAASAQEGHGGHSMDTVPKTGHGHGKHGDGEDKEKPRMRGHEFRTPGLELTRNGYLVDQKGNHVNLSDYRGKVVLMDFIYTGCKYGHCAYLNNKLRYVASKLPEHVGRDLQIVSITFDPEVDTSEKLDEYSRKWENDPSKWAFLTGAPGDIVDVMKRYGIHFVWDPKDESYNHTMRTLLINRNGETERIYRGMDYDLMQVIEEARMVLKGQKLPPQEDHSPAMQYRPAEE